MDLPSTNVARGLGYIAEISIPGTSEAWSRLLWVIQRYAAAQDESNLKDGYACNTSNLSVHHPGVKPGAGIGHSDDLCEEKEDHMTMREDIQGLISA